jgi:hypothetical protein
MFTLKNAFLSLLSKTKLLLPFSPLMFLCYFLWKSFLSLAPLHYNFIMKNLEWKRGHESQENSKQSRTNFITF